MNSKVLTKLQLTLRVSHFSGLIKVVDKSAVANLQVVFCKLAEQWRHTTGVDHIKVLLIVVIATYLHKQPQLICNEKIKQKEMYDINDMRIAVPNNGANEVRECGIDRI